MQNGAVEIQFPLYANGRLSGGSSQGPRSASGRLPRVTQVLALAISFQDMIQRGEARDYADLARLGCLTRERMSQIMEMVWLAPNIQQEILEFPPTVTTRFPVSEVAVRRVAGLLSWNQQRDAWQILKNSSHI